MTPGIDHHSDTPLIISMHRKTAISGLRLPPRSIIAPSIGEVSAPMMPAHFVASETVACPSTGSPITSCAK